MFQSKEKRTMQSNTRTLSTLVAALVVAMGITLTVDISVDTNTPSISVDVGINIAHAQQFDIRRNNNYRLMKKARSSAELMKYRMGAERACDSAYVDKEDPGYKACMRLVKLNFNNLSDPCRWLSCGKNATCVNGRCVCKPGWKNPPRCNVPVDKPDKCKGVTCSKNAYCVDGRCVCKPGWKNPPKCNKRVRRPRWDPCKNFDCNGHGTCVVKDGKPECQCDDGWACERCSLELPKPQFVCSDKSVVGNPADCKGCPEKNCWTWLWGVGLLLLLALCIFLFVMWRRAEKKLKEAEDKLKKFQPAEDHETEEGRKE